MVVGTRTVAVEWRVAGEWSGLVMVVTPLLLAWMIGWTVVSVTEM